MPQYHFSRWPPPLTRDSTPSHDSVEAATMREACNTFAQRHNLRITEIDGNTVWYETVGGDDVSYSVREG